MKIKETAKQEVVQVSVKVDSSVVGRADALVRFLAEQSGRPTTRADVLRDSIMKGLREMERASKT